MAKAHSKTMLAFGDVHFPYQNARAVEIFCRVAERIKPDLIVCLGDLLDCGQFSVHPPTHGMPQTDYHDDLRQAGALLDRLEAVCKRLVVVEGNHEYRLDRWAAATSEGRGAYSMLAPRLQLTKGRKRCTYVRYGSIDGRYPHYAVNSRIIAVHGWSYARHATKQHLQISQGRSVKGVIARVGSMRDRARFDANTDRHHHFVCTKCGMIGDFYSEAMDRLPVPQEVSEMGSVEGVHVELRGICRKCKPEAMKTEGRTAEEP